MAISINGIELSEDLVWFNEFNTPSIAQTIRPFIGDGVSVQSTRISNIGRSIILTAQRSGSSYSGFFTREQVQQLKQLEADGGTYTFIYETTNMDVIINAGGVSVTPLIRRPNQAETDQYTGSITMTQV